MLSGPALTSQTQLQASASVFCVARCSFCVGEECGNHRVSWGRGYEDRRGLGVKTILSTYR